MVNPTRRTALKSIGATCLAFSLPPEALAIQSDSKQLIRLGVIADLHGGLAVDAESRLDAFLESMADQECHALVQMGDFAYPNKKHQVFADKFNAAHDQTIHVIGNHEFDYGLTREDCFQAWGIEAAYYVLDLDGIRLLILDGNEKGSPDENGYPSFIGSVQKAWLEEKLAETDKPFVILSHQPLAGQSAIDNATEIQKLLTKYHEKILFCMNGHAHVDSLLNIDGVTYLHVNSASYYWVGGETRMAYYQDPLFTTLTIDIEKMVVSVEGRTSDWKGDSPSDIGYFDRDNAPPEEIVTPEIRARQLELAQR